MVAAERGAISVTVDARVLAAPMDGTKRHVLELTGALSALDECEVRALVRPDLDVAVRGRLEAAGAELVLAGSPEGARRSDVAHRPHQVDSPADLAVLGAVGHRLVITHQDLIAYASPSHFASRQGWEGYRQLTRMALLSADRVVFPSAHARAEALAEHLVEGHRASVVPLGVDHPLTRSLEAESAAPPGATELAGNSELLLCLGADFEHKHRPFALEVAAELQRRGWSGRLVLAGSHVPFGSTREEEARLLRANPTLREACADLGPVTEAGRAWLLDRASLVIYPTSHEGFGLVPFEAASHGVPCLWADGTALGELLPDDEAGVVRWDAAATAERAFALMRDEPARRRNLESIRRAATPLSWRATAERLARVYRETLAEPPSPGSVMVRHDGVMQSGFSEDAVRLVGPGGLLPAQAERPLLALAGRRWLRAPVFGALEAGYRVAHRLRRRT